MQLSDVRIRKTCDEGKMKAIVSVTFDDEFVVHDIKIIEGQNGLFIAMPSRKVGDGEYKDIAHPLTTESRTRIKEAIFEKYEQHLELLKEQNNNAEEFSDTKEYSDEAEPEAASM